MCATLSSQFSGHSRYHKLSRIIVAGVFASLYIVSSQAHLLLNEQQQYRARPPPIIANRLEQRSPSEVMVDLSNDLAYKILHLHSILNRNNFAFSPTALMCVLIAMYEGSAGRSSLEMRNALLMPNNRDVVRVGYRDIHRRLRTYFFDDDNPLKGLSLNKENVTITPEYETILKFYGYDLGMDMISSTAASTTTISPDETTTTPNPTTSTTTGTTYLATMTTPKEEEPLSTLPYGLSSTLQPPPLEEETITSRIETTEFPELPPSQPSTLKPENDETTTTSMPEESGEVVTVPNSEDIPEEERANIKKSKASDKLLSPMLPRKYLPPKFTQIRMTPPERIRRHLFGFKDVILTFIQPKSQFLHAPPPPSIALEAAPPPIHVARISPIDVIEPLGPISPIDDAIPLLPIKSAFPLDVEQGFLPSSKQGLNSEIVDHIFYLNNQDIIHTTFKVYNSVLYYRYFEHLKMSILELELDSTDYNLMIVLPDYDQDLSTAASTLRIGPTLRVLRKQLKPRWVQAIIPDFKLHGTMFLTNDLQNMGICDAFEPNRADFRPMTDESGIYVKHIEQTINVNIRTRPINHLKRSYGPQTRPIQVSVNHPFMFFIIDRDMDVATMAGRVLNPLNVRIQ